MADKLERADHRECQGMGMKPEGEKKVKEVEELIAEKLEEYPQLEGIPTAFCLDQLQMISAHFMYIFRPIREQHIC